MTTATTAKGERRKATLIAAGAELLAEGGFDAVRHRAVADRAGLPLASTTYYFSSLDDLVKAVVEYQSREELDDSQRRLAELPTQQRGVEALSELMLEMMLGPKQETAEADNEAIMVRFERLVGTRRRPYLQPVMHQVAANMRAVMIEIFDRSGFSIEPSHLDRLIALADGTVVHALLEAESSPRDAAAKVLQSELAALTPAV